jgi:prepilin-type N-terminal cleavage/methylation domain-containing protein
MCAPGKDDGPAKPRWGFSLLELVLVMVIIAVIAAIAVPRYSSAASRYRVETAARRVVADLALAQARAKALSSSQTVAFAVGTSQYQIVGMTDPDHGSSTYTVRLGDDPYRVMLQSVDFGGRSQVTFDAYGTADSNGAVVVRAGATQRTVVLDVNTGKAVMQ